MIDEKDLGAGDPGLNFTAKENRVVGMRLNEKVIRQLLSYGLRNIKETIDDSQQGGGIVEDCFLRAHGSGTVAQMKKWFRDQGNVTVVTNWPREDTPLPYIAVIDAGHREATQDEAEPVLGDHMGYEIHEGEEGDGEARELRGVPLAWTINIAVATTDQNLTHYLYWLVYYIIFSNKDQLIEHYDIHNARLGGQDLKYSPELLPTLCYAKMLELTYLTFFDWATRERIIRTVSLSVMIDTIIGRVDPVLDAQGALTMDDRIKSVRETTGVPSDPNDRAKYPTSKHG